MSRTGTIIAGIGAVIGAMIAALPIYIIVGFGGPWDALMSGLNPLVWGIYLLQAGFGAASAFLCGRRVWEGVRGRNG